MLSSKLKQNILKINSKVFTALKILNRSKVKILFILNKKKKLVGTITDGDLRRAFLKGVGTNDLVIKVMKKSPKFIYESQANNNKLIKSYFINKGIEQLPVLSKTKKLKKILIDGKMNNLSFIHNNPFVVMAGGIGKRLMPLTKNIPKPMIKVANKPILQHIIDSASSNGFYNFYISVNYLKHKIEKYFGDGNKFGVNISYIKESEPLGTAGSLSLLNTKNKLPIIVVNGDTITDVNFKNLIEYHNKNNSQFTIVTNLERQKRQIGVIETKSNKVIDLIEKPVVMTKINTGIYVMNKNVLKKIKKNRFLNMTDLIKKLIKKKIKVISFPIYERWEDLGTKNNLFKARRK